MYQVRRYPGWQPGSYDAPTECELQARSVGLKRGLQVQRHLSVDVETGYTTQHVVGIDNHGWAVFSTGLYACQDHQETLAMWKEARGMVSIYEVGYESFTYREMMKGLYHITLAKLANVWQVFRPAFRSVTWLLRMGWLVLVCRKKAWRSAMQQYAADGAKRRSGKG